MNFIVFLLIALSILYGYIGIRVILPLRHGLGHLLTPRRTKVGRQSTTDGDTGKTQSSPDGLKKKWHHGLKYGDTITNQQLQVIFQCSSQGGMRRALRTNSLVLISDHTKTSYHDRWQDGYFHYTGMGLKGDQSLAFAQNKTLAQSRTKVVYVKFCKLVMAFFGRAFFKD